MNDENAFQNALDENLDDSVTRLVFADWLQEQGDERSEGYRMLGILRLWPSRHCGAKGRGGFCVWGGDNHPLINEREWMKGNRHLLLPAVCFLAMPFKPGQDWQDSNHQIWKRFDSRRESEDLAAKIWFSLTQEDRIAAIALAEEL